MSVYKDRATDWWWVSCRFKDINGVARRTTKRGFKSEEERSAGRKTSRLRPT